MTWGPWELLVFNATLIVVAVLSYSFGRNHGVVAERQRTESLCHQAVLKRCSGSVRWVWNAISSGKELLQSEAKFFGPTTDDDMTKQGQPALSEVDQ